MKTSKWLIIATVLFFASSCGNNSTKKETASADSSSTTITTGDTNTGTVSPPVSQRTITVPEKVQSAFKEKYPDVRDVTWNHYEPMSTFDWDWVGWPMLDTSAYVARFNMDNTDYWTWYDKDNNWIGSLTTISDYKGLPAPVNKVISTTYSGYTIDAVDKEYDHKRTAYEIDLSKGDDKMKLLVDENGNVIKKKTLTEGVKTKDKM